MHSLERLMPGHVFRVPAGKYAGLAVIIDPGDEVIVSPYTMSASATAQCLGVTAAA